MKILAMMSRDLDKASTKFRLVQYLSFLQQRGIEVEFFRRDAVNKNILQQIKNSDLLFNQKCLVNGSLAKKLLAVAPCTLFDFDDAIYTKPGPPDFFLTRIRRQWRMQFWLKHANLVTTSNDFLATYARKYSSHVEIIPMSLDLTLWSPKTIVSGVGTDLPSPLVTDNHTGTDLPSPLVTDNHTVPTQQATTIGWAGSPVNAPLVARLDNIFKIVLARCPQVRIAILCGVRPALTCPYTYYPYLPGQESAFIQQLDIGVLPLDDDEHSKGKTPIKALQYMAFGLPIVGNVIGATAEVLTPKNGISVKTEEEWVSALITLIQNPEQAKSMGQQGRLLVEEHHNFIHVAEQLYQAILRTCKKIEHLSL